MTTFTHMDISASPLTPPSTQVYLTVRRKTERKRKRKGTTGLVRKLGYGKCRWYMPLQHIDDPTHNACIHYKKERAPHGRKHMKMHTHTRTHKCARKRKSTMQFVWITDIIITLFLNWKCSSSAVAVVTLNAGHVLENKVLTVVITIIIATQHL